MKKFLTLLAALLCLACFASCGGGDSSTASTGSSGSSGSATLPPESSSSVPETPETFTVTFKQEGFEDVTKTVTEGTALTDVPTPQAVTGYTVVWDVTDFSAIEENLTVNAVKTANEYTLTYDLEGKEGVTIENVTQTVTYDEAFTLATPTYEGYVFDGWVIKGTETALEAGAWTIAEDTTVVATWSIDPTSNAGDTGRY